MTFNTLFAVAVVAALVTLMIRSFVLHQWIFAGGYLFVLLALRSAQELKDKIFK